MIAVRVLDELVPAASHVTEQYGNNLLEADYGRLKSRLPAMRGLKQLRCARVITAGYAFIQNIRRGHYELGTEQTVTYGSRRPSTSWSWRSDQPRFGALGCSDCAQCNSPTHPNNHTPPGRGTGAQSAKLSHPSIKSAINNRPPRPEDHLLPARERYGLGVATGAAIPTFCTRK